MSKTKSDAAQAQPTPGIGLEILGILTAVFGLRVLFLRELKGNNGFRVAFDPVTAWVLGIPFILAGLILPVAIRLRNRARAKASTPVDPLD